MLDSLRGSWTTEHRRCQEDLSAFLDGQLTPRDRARVQRHLKECADCRADLDALRHTVSLLRAVPVLKPPRSFVLPVTEVKRQRQARRQRLAYVYLQAATAVATVLLVLVVSGDAVLRYAPAQPGARLSEAPPPATAVVLESAPVAGDSALPEPAPQTTQEPPAPIAAPTAQPLAAEAATEALPAPEQSPQALALEVGAEAADAGTATGTEIVPPQAEGTPAVKAKPSQTFVRAAPPPVSPTPQQESTAREAAQTAVPTTTPLPSPSNTPVPPTATPIPSPTNTPVPPTVEPSPTSPVAQSVPDADLASPGPAPGLWARLEGLRPILPRVEAVLALAVALLLPATLWLRRRQRPL
jgi:hypothetical protein